MFEVISDSNLSELKYKKTSESKQQMYIPVWIMKMRYYIVDLA